MLALSARLELLTDVLAPLCPTSCGRHLAQTPHAAPTTFTKEGRRGEMLNLSAGSVNLVFIKGSNSNKDDADRRTLDSFLSINENQQPAYI